MKILFVNNFRYRGGGEEFLMELLPGLIGKGVVIGIVCRPNTPLATMFKDMPIEVYPIEKSGLSGISSFFQIARIIKHKGYDIVCIQRGHDILQSWIASLLSNRRPKLIFIVHVADFINSRYLLGRMHRVVTISRHIAQKIRSFSPGLSDRISIIHHGIDLAAFNASRSLTGFIRKRFGLTDDTPIVSSSGSMWKNQIEFLDALVEIKKEISGVRYLLLTPLAPIPQLQAFKDRAVELGISDSILWLDTLPKSDMPSYFADIDIAISTFRNEGFGLWVVEALAMGTPVVAFDGGGVRDSLEGCPAGVLVRNGAQEMAAEVVRILKDREVRRRMSEAGPKWVAERFSRERMVDEYFQFFNSLVKKQ
ncbi:MAG: glycosyltransferase family 4 protein [Nitrospirae bacterium]|nr:glycosyltransferase family 4 protein [Nitrospirota bacterium]